MIQQSRPRLLLTRPLLQSQRFSGEVQARFGGVQTVIAPLLAARFLPFDLPKELADKVIFTSETAVEAAAKSGLTPAGNLPKLALCVGPRTAKAARALGFAVQDAGGDWRDLANMILADRAGYGPQSPLLFLAAAEAPEHLEKALRMGGVSVLRRNCYCQDPQPLTTEAAALLCAPSPTMSPVIAPIFSPRSARLFCDQIAALNTAAQINVAALSPAVAKALTLSFDHLRIADRPNSAAMLDCIGEWLQKTDEAAPAP